MPADQDKARQAMLRRSSEKSKSKSSANMNQYYFVIGFFIATMVGVVLYVVFDHQSDIRSQLIVDEQAILVHNGGDHGFTQAANQLFDGETVGSIRGHFVQGLTDTPQVEECRSGTLEDLTIPESYDYRQKSSACVKDESDRHLAASKDCPASQYVNAVISAAEDRICQTTERKVQLSADEVLDCARGKGCKGGEVSKVMQFAKRRGFVPATCYESTEDRVCPEDNFETQECRQERDIYKLVDFCMAQTTYGVKAEIISNGPVIAQVAPSTDFLTYSEGVYYRTADAFRFKGSLIVKVIGWEVVKGKDVWIVEPFFGSDWGQDGVGKIASGETEIDQYAFGFAVVPFSERMEEFLREMQASSSNEEEGLDEQDENDENANLDEIPEGEPIDLDEATRMLQEEEDKVALEKALRDAEEQEEQVAAAYAESIKEEGVDADL